MTDEYADFIPDRPDMSKEIGDLALALSKAQGAMTGAVKGSENPFFKSRYADLGQVIEAARKPLSDNGLAVIQTNEIDLVGIVVITTLVHESGQWIRGRLRMTPTKADPQGVGSAMTYARRYGYAAIIGLAQVDDDANSASEGQMDKKPIDEKKVLAAVDLARELVDEDDEDAGPGMAKEIYKPLSNDERMLFQQELKKNSPQGTRKTYWSCFHDHLKIQVEREKAA